MPVPAHLQARLKKVVAFVYLTYITSQASEALVDSVLTAIDNSDFWSSVLDTSTFFTVALIESGSDVFIEEASRGQMHLKDDVAEFLAIFTKFVMGTTFDAATRPLAEKWIKHDNSGPLASSFKLFSLKLLSYSAAYGFGYLVKHGFLTKVGPSMDAIKNKYWPYLRKQIKKASPFIGFATLVVLAMLSAKEILLTITEEKPSITRLAQTLINALIASSSFTLTSMLRQDYSTQSNLIERMAGTSIRIMIPSQLIGILAIILAEDIKLPPAVATLFILMISGSSYFLGHKAEGLIKTKVKESFRRHDYNYNYKELSFTLLKHSTFLTMIGASLYLALAAILELYPKNQPTGTRTAISATLATTAVGFFSLGAKAAYTHVTSTPLIRTLSTPSVTKAIAIGISQIMLAAIAIASINILTDSLVKNSAASAILKIAGFALAGVTGEWLGDAVYTDSNNGVVHPPLLGMVQRS